jgi:predicted transport protein
LTWSLLLSSTQRISVIIKDIDNSAVLFLCVYLIPEGQDSQFLLEKDMQKLTETNLNQIFGFDLVRSEFELQGLRIDTLAFDRDSKGFVIIEYKKDRNISVVDQGMAYLNLMLNNKADFILEYNDRSTGPSVLKRTDVDWSQSPVFFVAPGFTKYQQYAIGFKDFGIQLWEIRKYKNGIVTFNEVQSQAKKESIITITKSNPVARRVSEEIKVYTEDDHLSTVDDKVKDLYIDLKSAILGLGKDIEVRPKKFYIASDVSRSKLKAYLNIDFSDIQDPLKKARDVRDVGHYSHGNTEITISEPGEISYTLTPHGEHYPTLCRNHNNVLTCHHSGSQYIVRRTRLPFLYIYTNIR